MGNNTISLGINKQMEGSPLVVGLGAFAISAAANAVLPGSGLVLGMNVLGCLSVLLQFIGNNEWDKIFKACGISVKDGEIVKVPKLQEKTKTISGYMLRFNVVEGLSLTDMINKQEAIENYIGKRINITYNNRNFFIEVLETELKTEYPFMLPEVENLKGITFPIGVSRDKIEMLEVSENFPHLICAGASGGGKSVTLRSIITSIILLNDKYDSKVNLHLCDMKHGAEFSVFSKCKYVKSFSKTENECVNTLMDLTKEINRRYTLFEQNGVVSLSEYNKIHKNNKLEYELLIIDEFASLMYDKEVKQLLINFAQIARAAGVFMILSSQRPDASVIDGKIKCNVSNIIGLRVLNTVNSGIIWDGNGLEKLRGKGHALVRTGEGREIEVQGMYLSTEKARELIKHTYREEKTQGKKGKIISKDELDQLKCNKKDKNKLSFLEVLDEKE